MGFVPMLQVVDVEASSAWYQRALGLHSAHGGPEFEMLTAGPGDTSAVVLQLHRWDAHEHGFLGSPEIPVGNGVSLWLEVDDRAALDVMWERATASVAAGVLAEPSWNPQAHHHEFTLTDLDGYVLAVHTPFAPGPD